MMIRLSCNLYVGMEFLNKNTRFMGKTHLFRDLMLLMQVHFAASREALFSHFTKCGAIVKVTLLTDALTSHPKG